MTKVCFIDESYSLYSFNKCYIYRWNTNGPPTKRMF